MDIKEFKEILFKKAYEAGFVEYELFYNSGESFEVNVFRQEIEEYKNTSYQGAGFCGVIDGKMGYCYCERIDSGAADYLIEKAKENAAILENEDEKIYKGDSGYTQAKGISPALTEITSEEKIDFALAMEKYALSLDERIKMVESSVVTVAVGNTCLANSYGLELYRKDGYAMAYIEVNAKDGEEVKVNYEIWRGRDFSDFSPEEVSKKAVDKVLASMGAKPVKSGKYKIILENQAAVDLLHVFISNFYAENVQKGFSLMAGKLGERIASYCITITDSPTHENSITDITFDSEGAIVKEKTVVDKGVLKTYFHNYKTALKDNVKTTGNGFKSSYKSMVTTAPANCYIEPSEKDLEGLKQEMGDGILINSLSGLHAGCNAISGDFSLLAEGFLIENGKVKMPVEQITVAGNFYDMLKSIKETGSDLKFDVLGLGGSLGSPSLLIEGLSVSGL